MWIKEDWQIHKKITYTVFGIYASGKAIYS